MTEADTIKVRAICEDAGLPIDCEGGAPLTESYLQPLWELMHQEHGLILVESEMHDIMAVCKQIEAKLREDAPSGDSDAAETVIIPRGLLKAICLTGSAIAREANGDWGKKQSLIRLLKRCDTKVITHRQYKAPPPQQGAKGGGNEN